MEIWFDHFHQSINSRNEIEPTEIAEYTSYITVTSLHHIAIPSHHHHHQHHHQPYILSEHLTHKTFLDHWIEEKSRKKKKNEIYYWQIYSICQNEFIHRIITQSSITLQRYIPFVHCYTSQTQWVRANKCRSKKKKLKIKPKPSTKINIEKKNPQSNWISHKRSEKNTAQPNWLNI